MSHRVTRRTALLGLAAAAAGSVPARGAAPDGIVAGIAALERKLGGRIGVAALDLGTRARVGHRGRRALPDVLHLQDAGGRVRASPADRGDENLERRVLFSEADLVANSPVTRERVQGSGMRVAELCEAAVTRSDNTAGNLLLASFGGPPAFTAFAGRLGDEVTRLDRMETALNEAAPGDVRDTTSPAAVAETLRRLLSTRR